MIIGCKLCSRSKVKTYNQGLLLSYLPSTVKNQQKLVKEGFCHLIQPWVDNSNRLINNLQPVLARIWIDVRPNNVLYQFGQSQPQTMALWWEKGILIRGFSRLCRLKAHNQKHVKHKRPGLTWECHSNHLRNSQTSFLAGAMISWIKNRKVLILNMQKSLWPPILLSFRMIILTKDYKRFSSKV